MPRNRSGRFIISDATIQYQAAAARMKASLELDAKAMEHARGVVFERAHFHALPNADRLALVDMPAPALPLFELEAA